MIVSLQMNKLDIVYTYVNSKDKKWIHKIKKYKNDINAKRYNFYGEIYFSLLSVQKFFNWVNHIYIIHDDQVFSLTFLDPEFRKKITFIDHKDIIPALYLPTFNSYTIECHIWKIKGLSDFFIYLNDDVFFGNYIFYNDFFTKENNFKIFYTRRHGPIIVKDTDWFKLESEGVTRDTSEKLFNDKFKTNIYMNSRHMSWNLNKIACEYAYKLFYPYIKSTSKIKIRKYDSYKTDFKDRNNISFLHLVSYMQYHLGISSISNITSYFTHTLNKYHVDTLSNKKPKIFCINNLDEESLPYWEKLQKVYFNLFVDKYDILKNKILKMSIIKKYK